MFRRLTTARASGRLGRCIAEATPSQGGAARPQQSSMVPFALGIGAASAIAAYTVMCYTKEDTQLRGKDSIRERSDEASKQPRQKSQYSVTELASEADKLPNQSATMGVQRAKEAGQLAHDRTDVSGRLEDRFNPLHLGQRLTHPREMDARGPIGDSPARLVDDIKTHQDNARKLADSKQSQFDQKDMVRDLNKQDNVAPQPRTSFWGKTKRFFSRASDEVEEKAQHLKDSAKNKFDRSDEEKQEIQDEYRRKADHE